MADFRTPPRVWRTDHLLGKLSNSKMGNATAARLHSAYFLMNMDHCATLVVPRGPLVVVPPPLPRSSRPPRGPLRGSRKLPEDMTGTAYARCKRTQLSAQRGLCDRAMWHRGNKHQAQDGRHQFSDQRYLAVSWYPYGQGTCRWMQTKGPLLRPP